MQYLRTALLGAILLAGSSHSTPISNHPTETLVKRADPSKYPGGGSAYTNEWSYLNFDVSKPEDKAAVEKIHAGFDGMRRAVLAAISSAVEDNDIYTRWFPADDQVRTGSILPILRNIIPEKIDNKPNTNANVGPIVANLVVDNTDFWKGVDGKPNCNDAGLLAYTDQLAGRTHFCAQGLQIQDAVEISCETDRAPLVNNLMDTTARLFLHELVHFKPVFEPELGGSLIGEQRNKDGKIAYGPERAFALVHGTPDGGSAGSGESPGAARFNADNYAWLAMNSFMAEKNCAQGNFADPAPY